MEMQTNLLLLLLLLLLRTYIVGLYSIVRTHVVLSEADKATVPLPEVRISQGGREKVESRFLSQCIWRDQV